MTFENTNLFDSDQKSNHLRNQIAELTGTISAVFFESPDSLFKVLLVDLEECDFDWNESQIVVTGNVADVQENGKYRFKGKLVTHPKYGLQLQITEYKAELPNTRNGVVAYLSGDNFKGIGEKTAEKIVDLLGNNAIELIKNQPDKLEEVDISEKQKATIISVLDQSNGLESVLIQLGKWGITGKIASNIVNKYQEDTIKIIEDNPYQLVDEIENVGFKRADQIGKQLNLKLDFPARIQAGILETIKEWCNSTGDTYINSEPLLAKSQALLGREVSPEMIANQVLELGSNGKVIGESGRIYLKWIYQAEEASAIQVRRLAHQKIPTKSNKITKAIQKAEEEFNFQYDEVQKEAIALALSNSLTIITGGPGTGKTTIIKGLIHSYAKLKKISLDINEYTEKKFPIQLAAPTGRAAKRMSQTTGIPAKTIHRLLGLNGNDDLKDEDIQEISGELLVIDEMSMVDIGLFNTLINAISLDMQVVLVGDKDQLPSVGPGQVFNDLIRSNLVPTISLSKIYRQEQGSSIIQLAHHIQNGSLPDDFQQNKSDKSFFEVNANQVTNVIDQIAQRAIAKGMSKNDLQVLAPMYRGSAGVDEINRHLQQILNPPKQAQPEMIASSSQNFRIGDKVLQLVNAPENDIFNGDIGEVTGIVTEKEGKGKAHLIVDYDGNEVTYMKSDLGQLTLAYCISIHKSQGSEFPVVILPMIHQYHRMLQRNLLYTGLTRAADSVILIGETSAYQLAVSKESANRKTSLKERINPENKDETEDSELETNSDNSDMNSETNTPKEKLEKKMIETVLTNTMIEQQKINPMIGMDNTSPFDFVNNKVEE